MTAEAFVSSVRQLLVEGTQKGYSRDYVAGLVHQLVRDHPEVAQGLNFPAEPASIRKEIVDPLYEAVKSEAPKPGEKDDGFDWSETEECLSKEWKDIAISGATAAAMAKKNPLLAIILGLEPLAKIAGCVIEGFGRKDE